MNNSATPTSITRNANAWGATQIKSKGTTSAPSKSAGNHTAVKAVSTSTTNSNTQKYTSPSPTYSRRSGAICAAASAKRARTSPKSAVGISRIDLRWWIWKINDLHASFFMYLNQAKTTTYLSCRTSINSNTIWWRAIHERMYVYCNNWLVTYWWY